MLKVAMLLTTLSLSTWLVTEVRDQRSLNCFVCSNVKCVIRSVDENPKVIFTHPAEIASEIYRAENWWD